MLLIASITLNAATGQSTGFCGTPGALALVQTTHTPGSGIYVVSFATELNLRTTQPVNVLLSLTDTTKRALLIKQNQQPIMVPHPVPVLYLYTITLHIAVSQVFASLPGPCTTTPTDPDTAISIRVFQDVFVDEGARVQL